MLSTACPVHSMLQIEALYSIREIVIPYNDILYFILLIEQGTQIHCNKNWRKRLIQMNKTSKAFGLFLMEEHKLLLYTQ